ncbi:MAG: hypothetical protein SF053_04980 [Bacteroidia bacterium]|nr:hypothetical protein [Bacteroidia bacterium]
MKYMMRNILILTCLMVTLLLAATPLRGQAMLINTFDLVADGSDILLQWELPAEPGIVEFRIFRKYNDELTLTHVATIPANGTLRYSYLDDGIFKTTSRVLHYELQVVTQTQVFTFVRSLSHNPTSIQRTWGSIKSMFR